MNKSLEKVYTFLINILIFAYFRKTFTDNIFVLIFLACFFSTIGLILGFLLKFGIISPSSEPNFIVSFLFELLSSFVSSEKISFILFTLITALIFYHNAKNLITYQNKHDKSQNERLLLELRINTRATILVLSGALSFIMKILTSTALMLILMAYISGLNNFDSSILNLDFYLLIPLFLFIDSCCFISNKFFLPSLESALKQK